MGNCLLTKGKESLQMDLLWTNPNPSSSFTAQTVSLDLSAYSMVIVTSITRFATDTNVQSRAGLGTALCTIGEGSTLLVGGFTSATHRARIRTFTASTTGVTFNFGYGIDDDTDTSDAAAIPYQIYGIKTFKFIQKYVSGLQGIDTNNVIYNNDGGSNITYTATQDCYLTVNANAEWVKLNGVFILNDSSANNNFYGVIPIKSGQTITTGGTTTGHRCDRFRVYGILGE